MTVTTLVSFLLMNNKMSSPLSHLQVEWEARLPPRYLHLRFVRRGENLAGRREKKEKIDNDAEDSKVKGSLR